MRNTIPGNVNDGRQPIRASATEWERAKIAPGVRAGCYTCSHAHITRDTFVSAIGG